MNRENGGPAFPQHPIVVNGYSYSNEHQGMTLRDYFAAKAMQALIPTASNGTAFGGGHPETNLKYAIVSYALADAMLKAREA